MDNQWAEVVVIVFMIAIIFSLGSGLYYILFQRERSAQAVKALTFRISLSILLFVGLFIAFAWGWIHPHGILRTNKQTQKEITIPHPQSANTMQQPQTQNGVMD